MLNAGAGGYHADEVPAPATTPSASTERSGFGWLAGSSHTAASGISPAVLNAGLNAGLTASASATLHGPCCDAVAGAFSGLPLGSADTRRINLAGRAPGVP
jgi:hypothetical protein